jgi:polysaccharide pyruvyl transferase WcaK-like protein
VGSGDRKFMSQFRGLELIEPTTVAGLVGAIGSADSLFSVRMHPALTASMLNVPVVAVPYCGKVDPTMSRIGVEEIVLREGTLEAVMRRLDEKTESPQAWTVASQVNREWLSSVLR